MKRTLVIIAAILLLGAGCSKLADEAATDAIKPISVPLDALKDSKQKLGDINARTQAEQQQIDAIK